MTPAIDGIAFPSAVRNSAEASGASTEILDAKHSALYLRPMTPERTFTFLELFAGGGMARAGLGTNWRCLLANDLSVAKAEVYRSNWGDEDLIVGDVATIRADRIKGRPDLAWLSSPCQDVSNAGVRAGLDGGRSGSLWPALDLVRQLSFAGRAPRLVVIENVLGMASSRDGGDLAAVAAALSGSGYSIGALVIDAKWFVPQSRPRLFVVASAGDVGRPAHLVAPSPTRPWHSAAVAAAAERVTQSGTARWIWWAPSLPPHRRLDLVDILEDAPATAWNPPDDAGALLALMSDKDRDRLKAARASGTVVGTVTRRMRPDGVGSRLQRAELRLDGVAGCLRSPGGGSSQQSLIVADADNVRTRRFSNRECARLMGLPDTFRLPRRREEALQLLGDGVAASVVSYLARELLEPLLSAEVAEPKPERKGIKGSTRATTLYLLPYELQRLRRLAVDLNVSLHDLMLRGLDRVLAEQGQRPLERYK